jgi:tRNA A-37 threonylcarbamoyl transferase component Bud32
MVPLHIDFTALASHVQAAVKALLPKLPAIVQAYEPDSAPTVQERALHKFLRPLVKTALVQAMAENLRPLVHLDKCQGDTNLGFKCVSGRYGASVAKRLRKLGSGYFGQVLALDEHRAVKVQKFEIFDEQAMLRLQDEVEIQAIAARLGVAARIIDTFHCVCRDSGLHAAFIVQERLPGTTLSDAVLSPKDKHTIAAKIDKLVAKLHAAKVFHNDLHDSNVMVHKTTDAAGSTKWQVRILDFGLATRSSDGDPWRRHRQRRQGEQSPQRHTDFRIVDELRNPKVLNAWEKQQPKVLLKALTHSVVLNLRKSNAIAVV